MTLKQQFKKLSKSRANYSSVISEMESLLSQFVEFEDYSIFYQDSDGFVLEYETKNALLRDCIEVINRKGKLSFDDYLDLSI